MSQKILVPIYSKNSEEVLFRYVQPGSSYEKRKWAKKYGFENVTEFWDEVVTLAEEEEMTPWSFLKQGKMKEYYCENDE